MNWGYKILIVYGLFVAGTLFLVIKSSNQKMDLVTPDYYARELKYQQRIDDVKRADALAEPVKFEIKNNLLVVHFPATFAGKKITGSMELYCPSDEQKDSRQEFSILEGSAQMTIPSGDKGLYELHVSWQVEGSSYYFEQKITL